MGEPLAAAEDFKAVLDLDVGGIEWPPWKAKPDLTSLPKREQYEREMIRLRKRAEELHVVAVEKIHYVLYRVEATQALEYLLRLAEEYDGLPPGLRAAELAKTTVQKMASRAYRYDRNKRIAHRHLDALLAAAAADVERQADPKPVADVVAEPQPIREDGAVSSPSAPKAEPGEDDGSTHMIPLVLASLAVAGVLVFAFMRRRRLDRRR